MVFDSLPTQQPLLKISKFGFAEGWASLCSRSELCSLCRFTDEEKGL